MNYIALKTEINNDPVGMGYAGKTDKQISDLLNAKTFDGDIPIRDIDKLVTLYNLRAKLRDAINDANHNADIRGAAENVLNLGESLVDVVSQDTAQALANILLSANIITSEHLNALLALKSNRRSRAQIISPNLGAENVTELDVNRARFSY